MMRRFVDLSVPLGCAIGIGPSAVAGKGLPTSIAVTMPGHSALIWSFFLFVSCTAIVCGVFLRRTLPEIAFVLEYPGAICACVMCLLYGVALVVHYGIASGTWLAIGFSLAISLYFLARFLELVNSRRSAIRLSR